MSNWSVDKIIAIGLMASFVITVLAMDISAVLRGDMDIGAIAKELSIGLFSYMGRGFISNYQQQQVPQNQSQVSQALGQISEAAGQAQTVVNAVENLGKTKK